MLIADRRFESGAYAKLMLLASPVSPACPSNRSSFAHSACRERRRISTIKPGNGSCLKLARSAKSRKCARLQLMMIRCSSRE